MAGLDQAADHAEERRLVASGRSEEADELSGADMQIGGVESEDVTEQLDDHRSSIAAGTAVRLSATGPIESKGPFGLVRQVAARAAAQA